MKYGEFTEQQIKTILTYGKGPKIVVTELEGAYGKFTPGIGSNELEIDKKLVESLEKAEGRDRDALLFLVAVTILHETTHYGDDQDGVQQTDEKGNRFEEGLAFEKEAYGEVITLRNAREKIETWIKKHSKNE